MKILLLGKNGQVGSVLERTLEVVGPVVAWDQETVDFEKPLELANKVRVTSPSVIVNAAAYTAVDRAEAESERAYCVNAKAVEVLADCAKASGALLIHYSTDYVFDGTKPEPYLETDTPNPLSVYGKSKLAGESAIRASGCRHLLFRTSWVFAAQGQNFPRTILRLASERDSLNIIEDQVGAPTSADLIADVTRRALERVRDRCALPDAEAGTYHVCAKGETSWYDYACFIVEEARTLGHKMRVAPNGITPVPMADYPQAAQRPGNSRLNTDKLASWLGITMPPWETEVARVVRHTVLKPDSV